MYEVEADDPETAKNLVLAGQGEIQENGFAYCNTLINDPCVVYIPHIEKNKE